MSESEEKNQFAATLNDAMDSILSLTSKIKAALSDSDENTIKHGFKEFLVGWLEKAIADPDLARRRVRLHASFLLEQCAEALHDLDAAGAIIDFDKKMASVDKAHDFTANIVNDNPQTFIRKYEGMIREVSVKDTRTAEERDERKRVIQSNFREFVRMRQEARK